MEIILGRVLSKEISSFRFYKDALDAFESILSKGLLRFNSDLVETLAVTLVCLSPQFTTFYNVSRPKYYEDRNLKIQDPVTPEVRMYKCLTADFVVDFDSYFKLNGQEDCLRYVALSFLDFLKNLKYPGKLKKFEKEEFLQAVKDIFIENSILSVNDEI